MHMDVADVTMIPSENINQYLMVQATYNADPGLIGCKRCQPGIRPIGQNQVHITDYSGQHTRTTVRLMNHPGTMECVLDSGGCTAGDKLYAGLNGTVRNTPTGVGHIGYAKATGSAGARVEVFLTPFNESGLLLSSVAADASIGTSSTAEALFASQLSMPANTFKVGDILVIQGWGIFNATNSTDTFTLRAKLGTNIIIAGAAYDAADAEYWALNAYLVIQTVGAAGTARGFGDYAYGAVGTAAKKNAFGAALTAIDFTAAMIAGISNQTSVSHAGNAVNQQHIDIRLLRT